MEEYAGSAVTAVVFQVIVHPHFSFPFARSYGEDEYSLLETLEL